MLATLTWRRSVQLAERWPWSKLTHGRKFVSEFKLQWCRHLNPL
jgi:hypothetical protein